MSCILSAIRGRWIGLVVLAGAVVALACIYFGGDRHTLAKIDDLTRTTAVAVSQPGLATPTACTYPNPIQNPGFETGQLAPWVIDGFNNPPAISTAEAHTGTYSVLVGSSQEPEPNGDSALYQQVTVPPTGGTLSFWYLPCGDFGAVTFDWQDAYVTDLNGNILATIMHISDTKSCMWLQRTFDMAPFAGQTVRIKFLVYEDGFGDLTYMYVDDVAITAPDCLASTPSPTPPPPPPTASPTGTPPVLTSTATATPTCLPQAPPLPTGVLRAVGAYFPANGNFYIVGGRSSDAPDSDFTHPFEYDPTANTWITSSATYPDNQLSDMACGVLTASGTPAVYCVGGSAAGATTATARVFRYNPITEQIDVLAGDAWPGNPGGNTLPGGFAVVGNKLYIMGGFDINFGMTQQTWQFDPTAGVGSKWTRKQDYPAARGFIPAAAISGMIYTAGGAVWTDSNLLADTSDSYKYDPVANTWTAIANIPRATEQTHALTFGGLMWVISGGVTPPNPSPEVDIYDPVANTWSLGSPLTRWLRSFAADSGGGHMWLAGGYNGGTNFYVNPPLVLCSTPTPQPTPGATGSPTATGTPSRTSTPTGTGTPPPTATTGEVCTVTPTGASASCSPPGTYDYSFSFYTFCGVGLTDFGTVSLEAAAGPGGPWTVLDQQNFSGGLPSGTTTTIDGTFTESSIPQQYNYYHATIRLETWPIPFVITNETSPAPLCRGTQTPTPISPPPTSTPCSIRFTDVPPGSTFYPYIHCLACMGIVSGYADGTFKPNNPVTRGQLSKIVSNSAGFNDNQTTQLFQDVPVGSTFQAYVGRLASRGYISGYPCGGPGEPCVPPGNLPYFRPNANATRGQISKIDANAAGFADPPSGRQFQDVPPGSTYYTYTYRLATRNVMQGYACGGANEPCIPPANLPYFRPDNNATRGQTSKIVANTFFPDCQAPARH